MSEEETAPTEEEVSEQEEEVQEEQQDDIEERARSMGWTPKEEFRGDPEKWRSAEEFVKKGENELPILRERYRKVEGKLHEMERTLKQFAEHHKNVSEREYKKALEDIKRQKAEAVELGDKDAFTKAEAQEEELRSHQPKEIKVGEEETQPGVHPDFPGWVAENPWYESDKVAQAAADAIATDLATKRPDLQGRAFFDAVKEQVKQELPNKFENPRRKQAPPVEGAGSTPKKGKGKTYADLPEEAKKACDNFVKQGLMSKEQYLKEYDWS